MTDEREKPPPPPDKATSTTLTDLEAVRLPTIPSDPLLPDFEAIKADPSLAPAERLQIVILDRLTAITDTLLGPEGSLEQLRMEVRERQLADQVKIQQLLEILTKVVDAHSSHDQRDQEVHAEHHSRLNRQRADIDDSLDAVQKLGRRVDGLNKLAHDQAGKLHKHELKILELDRRVEALETVVRRDAPRD